MELETIIRDGKVWRRVMACDDPRMVGAWKCQCGQYLKREERLDAHLQTPSHKKSLEWLENNRPTQPQFLTRV